MGHDNFTCGPRDTLIFYAIDNDLAPGHRIAAVETGAGRIAGTCDDHLRPSHVSLGIRGSQIRAAAP
ncbi:MAG: hypothetical protein ACYC6N_21245 [Pirellulaceae bacterium]